MSIAVGTLTGNLGKDPETRFSEGGLQITNFSLAVNRWKRGEQVTDWYRVVLFGKLAERFEKAGVGRGDTVTVYGELGIEKFTNRDNKEFTIVELHANNFSLVRRVNAVDGEEEPDEGYAF